jgi:cation diffusion facilitator CzcD-associated flavoprotein CzcO
LSLSPVAIIGAGPYGLSVAAHLKHRGVRHRIFGHPMQFWAQIADAGGERYLKSFCFGTSISTPVPGYTFADFNTPLGLETFEPCSMANFVDYGRWFQERQVPWAEPKSVVHVEPNGEGYRVSLEGGETFDAVRVVVATGLCGFAVVPQPLAGLPAALVTHCSRVDDFRVFRGRRVAVVGAGQSALEAVALLLEVGAAPQLVAREEKIKWQTRVRPQRSYWRKLRSPISGLGTGPKAWTLTRFPGLSHRMPDRWRVEFVRRHLPPEGAWWLRPRVEGKAQIHAGFTIATARPCAGGVELLLRRAKDGRETRVECEHVVAGTGYHVDVDRMDFLSAEIRAQVDRLEGSPKLNAVFESSKRGLYFVGTASAMSFGPLFRFVVGAEYTSKTIAESLA